MDLNKLFILSQVHPFHMSVDSNHLHSYLFLYRPLPNPRGVFVASPNLVYKTEGIRSELPRGWGCGRKTGRREPYQISIGRLSWLHYNFKSHHYRLLPGSLGLLPERADVGILIEGWGRRKPSSTYYIYKCHLPFLFMHS